MIILCQYCKSKLMSELVEARSKRAYYAAKCNNSFWINPPEDADYIYWKTKDEELTEILNLSKND